MVHSNWRNKRILLLVAILLVALAMQIGADTPKKKAKPRHYPIEYCVYEIWKRFATGRKFTRPDKAEITYREEPIHLIELDSLVYDVQSTLRFETWTSGIWPLRYKLTYTGDTLLNHMLLDTFYWECEKLKYDQSKGY